MPSTESTGGQLYELIVGHDRFIADIRPILRPILEKRRLTSGLCCHPHDVCTELIAREAGVLITNHIGQPLNVSLDLESDVSWIGYANSKIWKLKEPRLFRSVSGARYDELISRGKPREQACGSSCLRNL